VAAGGVFPPMLESGGHGIFLDLVFIASAAADAAVATSA